MKLSIDEVLVRQLVMRQFPKWGDLEIRGVVNGGWDNRTFHLGEKMLLRMPSGEDYAGQVEKEHRWLRKLGALLPIEIPEPLAMGEPGEGYPWKWSIYRWIEGETASVERIGDMSEFAKEVGGFLRALESIDSTGGPESGKHNFYRGGDLRIYDEQVREALRVLEGRIDVKAVRKVWEEALESKWDRDPVWVHGDVSEGNLLVREGKLRAVIDFGCMGIGDPACDLAIGWTFFRGESRRVFKEAVGLDEETWARGKGWVLWKALVVAAGLIGASESSLKESWRIIYEEMVFSR